MNFSFFNLGGKKEITLDKAVPEKKVVQEELPTEEELRLKRAEADRLEREGNRDAARKLHRQIGAAGIAFLAAQGDLTPDDSGTPPATQDALRARRTPAGDE
jgi:hypothetical protein